MWLFHRDQWAVPSIMNGMEVMDSNESETEKLEMGQSRVATRALYPLIGMQREAPRVDMGWNTLGKDI